MQEHDVLAPLPLPGVDGVLHHPDQRVHLLLGHRLGAGPRDQPVVQRQPLPGTGRDTRELGEPRPVDVVALVV